MVSRPLLVKGIVDSAQHCIAGGQVKIMWLIDSSETSGAARIIPDMSLKEYFIDSYCSRYTFPLDVAKFISYFEFPDFSLQRVKSS